MDNSLLMAFLAINSMETEARSALPDAPVVTARRAGSTRGSRLRPQGWLAGFLHYVARALEPGLPVGAEPRRRGPATVKTTST
jgi:hypothetical protein